MRNFVLPSNYQTIVTILKEKIRQARRQASLKLNADLLSIYHQIGCAIAEQELKAGWGAKVIDRLSLDLKSEFEDMRGLSRRNLTYMRDFALAYPYFPFLQGGLAKIEGEADAANGGSILQGELAKLTWSKERDLENAMTSQLMKVLLELGQYFAFLGKQYRLVLKEREYFVDLLFYHTRLKRYIVIELKIGEFQPEYIGQMGFYLSLADEQLKDGKDEKSIGLILCKTKDGLVAEYALRDTNKAIGIAQYKLHEKLPDNIQGELPSIEEIERNMEEELRTIENPTKFRMEKLVQKLAFLQRSEVKTPVTYHHMCFLFDNSIRPLFTHLLVRLGEFSDYFLSCNYHWTYNQGAKNLDELEKDWKNEQHFRIGEEPHYYYGVKLLNYNNNQPFIKKLYDEKLTEEELQITSEIVCKAIFDQIEWNINRISMPKVQLEMG